jgi:hypothetical protein
MASGRIELPEHLRKSEGKRGMSFLREAKCWTA